MACVFTCSFCAKSNGGNSTSQWRIQDFPWGGGHGLPRWLHFKNFVCQNERIWTLRGACAGHPPPLNPPMHLYPTVMMCISNLILIDNTSSNIWLNIPVYAQMYKLNGLWCGLLTCVNCIFILIPLWPCVCISIHVRVYKLARIWSMIYYELNRTHPTLLLWTTRSTINYAVENAVLSLCSMNIAKKNYWVTFKCTVATFHYTYWCLWLLALEHFFSIWDDPTPQNSTDFLPRRATDVCQITIFSPTCTSDFQAFQGKTEIIQHQNATISL